MWFKNLMIYSFTEQFTFDNKALEEALENGRFSPCGSQELSSYGWTAPAGRHSENLQHSGSGFILLCARKEERILPASVIKDFVNERVTVIEEEQLRKVRKKERDEIKDEVLLELTPKAFTRSSFTYGLLAPELGYLLVDAGSAKKADDFTAYLRKSLGSLPVKPVSVNEAPVALFTAWLDGKLSPPDDLTIGEECELNASDDEGGVVRLSRHQLTDSDEIKTHLAAGKLVVKLGLEWQDSLSFVLDNELGVKKLRFSDTLQEQAAEDGSADAAAEFDAQFTLSSLELAKFVPRLIEIFGGLQNAEGR
ncbi:MAG: recombination-associated protein RdgC [Gammaproteobacteria bacterium]|nr:recombination-associated protein RdgC [Gammaproteobacteria bacterium]